MNTKLHRKPLLALVCLLLAVTSALAQESPASKDKDVYNQLKAFSLTGGAVDMKGIVLKRVRSQITLDGTVYLGEPVNGKITGAVFIGEGKFVTETPTNDFEHDNLKRLLGTDVLESDFKTAVFRFTDNTGVELAPTRTGPVNERAQKLARETDERTLREIGANLPARLAISMLNLEKPGFFFAQFDGGKRGRFSMVLDYQNRIPVANFGINGGEKGLIWSYNTDVYGPDVWLAFYSLEDYQRGTVTYSDMNDQIDVKSYRMDIDLRDHKDKVKLNVRLEAEPYQPNVRAVSFRVGEDLGEYENQRLKKQMRVVSVRRDGVDLPAVQENWEGGFTVFLPESLKAREKLELDMTLEGDFLREAQVVDDCYYPRSNTTWFPRHGYLDRATFDLTFRHPKSLRVASVGVRTSEEIDPEDKNALVARYQMTFPVALVTFALGPFKRHTDSIKWEKGGAPTPLEFNSLPGDYLPIKEDFILAELNNAVRYFTVLFGDYPYQSFGAAFHPFGFGQGFPTLLMIPNADHASKYTYQFIAHETAHQWWGNIVAWRSYRDQWLSEGFAEYSGILYTGLRANPGAKNDLLGRLRSSLKDPPMTTSGMGKGRLVDVGPIILGHRLSTSKTLGAYQTLIYNKGALVLRMLHYLLSNPTTGEGQPFFDMMTDFVERYRNKTASSDDFRQVANEHFVKSPIGQQYGFRNLDWLFSQEVYQTALPSYEMQYKMEDQPDGKVIISGTITQQNAPEDWIMVLPVRFSFGGKQQAGGTVLVQGPSSPFKIKLPMRPQKVELDPDHWIIADKVSTRGN